MLTFKINQQNSLKYENVFNYFLKKPNRLIKIEVKYETGKNQNRYPLSKHYPML